MPSVITALVVQKRDPRRVNVYLDGRFAFGLAAIEAVHLRVGQVLSTEEVAQLRSRDAEERAHDRALRLLAHRPRSEAEIAQRLERAGVEPPVVEAVLVRLRRVGLVDDRAFARYWVDNRQQFRPHGKRMLRHELVQKGVPEPIIEEVLAGLDEEQSALNLARQQVRRLHHLDRTAFRQRLSAYLARRGFDYEVIAEAVRQAWGEVCGPSSPDDQPGPWGR